MVVPYWNPGKVLMTGYQIKVRPVCCKALSIIVQAEGLFIWEGDPTEALTPAIVSVLVLVDVITQVNHVVY